MTKLVTADSKELPQQYLEEALGYVCYERTYHYLFTQIYQIESYPLFYLDRFIGWKFNTAGEPFLPLVNGLETFLDNYIKQEISTDVQNIEKIIHNHFKEGYYVSLIMQMEHLDGSKYYTTVLLERIEQDRVIYTHINEANKTTKLYMDINTFNSKIHNNENTINLTIYNYSPILDKLKNTTLLESVKFIFHELYQMDIRENDFIKAGKKISTSLTGFYDLKEYIQKNSEQFLSPSISKLDQQILCKQINSKLHPIKHFLKYVLHQNFFLDKEFRTHLEVSIKNIDEAISKLQFFSSMVVKQPSERSLELYFKSLDQLILLMQNYQELNANLLNMLIRGKIYER